MRCGKICKGSSSSSSSSGTAAAAAAVTAVPVPVFACHKLSSRLTPAILSPLCCFSLRLRVHLPAHPIGFAAHIISWNNFVEKEKETTVCCICYIPGTYHLLVPEDSNTTAAVYSTPRLCITNDAHPTNRVRCAATLCLPDLLLIIYIKLCIAAQCCGLFIA